MGQNISVYVGNGISWELFKKACEKEGKRPNTVICSFIETYTNQILGQSLSPEIQIAQQMAKKTFKGRPLLTTEETKQIDCPLPPEPDDWKEEWE